jgi:tetratricopeptide (TPR) repeat protein
LPIALPPDAGGQNNASGWRDLTATGLCCSTLRSRRRLRAWALVACVGFTAAATPVDTARADETSPANVAAARRHFDKARAYYGQGAYREAIGELEAAHSLDPNAKDLVFNLGVVHEKLVDIDDALKWFRLYTTMNLTPAERERADAYVHRLEGAKKELDDKRAAEAARAAAAASSDRPPPPPPPERTGNTRTVLMIGTGSLTVVALGVGVVMGIKAEEDRPASPYITGRNGLTYTAFANEQSMAHSEAVVADIGFGIAAAAAAAPAVVFFTRPHAAARTGVSAAPITGGGAFFVQGSF